MANVSLTGVTKIFDDGEIVAVNDLNIDIRSGEFLVLVGPSGCGKSTTLRMIAGLETPTSGTIQLDGETINKQKPQERNIAMVFQSYALYPHMTVRENMAFSLEESTSMSREEINNHVTEAAETLDIGELLDRKPSDLSGGQQQRVALGRVIVRDPDVFLLDEPLSNLDAKLRAEMRTELQQLQQKLGTTAVYVTHDQDEAMTMADRVAILNEGELQQVDTPLGCYHQPANMFVAGFIGEPAMNFHDTTMKGNALVSDRLEYPLDGEIRSDINDGAELILGIRPEDIEVEEGGADDHVFPAVVEVVEPHGNEYTLHFRFENQENSEKTFTATVGGMRKFKINDRISVRIPQDAIHLFDATTGEAVHNRILDESIVDRVKRSSPA